MKRYRFPLETALRVRRVQEEAARFALVHANLELRRVTEAHRAAVLRYAAIGAGEALVDFTCFRRHRDQADRLAALVQAAWTAVGVASAEATSRHAQWLAANRRVAALEHLDERRRAEWMVEEQRAETQAVDESALSRWLAQATAGFGRSGARP